MRSKRSSVCPAGFQPCFGTISPYSTPCLPFGMEMHILYHCMLEEWNSNFEFIWVTAKRLSCVWQETFELLYTIESVKDCGQFQVAIKCFASWDGLGPLEVKGRMWWFEREMRSVGSHIWTFNPKFMPLFVKITESWGRGSLQEKVCRWGPTIRVQGFLVTLPLLSLCGLKCDRQVFRSFLASLPTLHDSCHSSPTKMDSISLEL